MAARIRTPLMSRLIKIGYSFYTYRHDQRPPPPAVPYLRLRGHWLRQAGFSVGQKVSVQVTDRCITIVPSEAE